LAASEASTENGSSSSGDAGFAAGADACGVLGFSAASPLMPNGCDGTAADNFSDAGAAAFAGGDDFAGAARGGVAGFLTGAPPPFMEAPQNGHSVASSSRTDCLQAGHVGRSITLRIQGVENGCQRQSALRGVQSQKVALYNLDVGVVLAVPAGSSSRGRQVRSPVPSFGIRAMQFSHAKPEAPPVQRDAAGWDLAAESITVKIRWFGVVVGYVLVNFLDRHPESQRAVINAILTLGAVYALVDTLWSLRGKVFLSDLPLVISLMEAVFIGLLCYFDAGLESPFRFYYFLSLLVCAMRYSPRVTIATFALHAISYGELFFSHGHGAKELSTLAVMLVSMGWVTWACTSLADLLKGAGRRLTELNNQLRQNQTELEGRIAERTVELQMSQALVVQQEKQAAFGLLAAGIAHEVGNPLAAISSLVQMLNRRHNDEYTRERLQMVDDQLRRIQGTLRELVDFSRPATTHKTMCDVHEVIDAALNIAKYYKRIKGKRIVTRYAADLPLLRVMRDQLVQVFLNLILNAMDATEEGGTIEITTCLRGGWIEATVRDDGHGIPSTDRSRVFQPYFTTKETGTGLGLFVCSHIMRQMIDGRIELTETSPAGTIFTVALTCDNVRRHPDVAQPTLVSTEVRST
jgi:signal transduction histidine kinase